MSTFCHKKLCSLLLYTSIGSQWFNSLISYLSHETIKRKFNWIPRKKLKRVEFPLNIKTQKIEKSQLIAQLIRNCSQTKQWHSFYCKASESVKRIFRKNDVLFPQVRRANFCVLWELNWIYVQWPYVIWEVTNNLNSLHSLRQYFSNLCWNQVS